MNSERRNKDWFDRTIIDTSFEAQKHNTITARKVPQCEHRFIVKLIKKNSSESQKSFKRRVRNEIEIQIRLRSQFVPILFNYHESDEHDRFYLALEFAQISMDKFLFLKEQMSRPIPLFVIQRWSRHMFSGLDHLDQLGVVHRDLKPSNLLIISRSMEAIDLRHARILISDYGSAHMKDLTYMDENTNITRQYSAPKLLCRDGVASSKSDLFSMMIVLVKCATYRHVFMDNRVHDHPALASSDELRELFSQRPRLVVGESTWYASLMANVQLSAGAPSRGRRATTSTRFSSICDGLSKGGPEVSADSAHGAQLCFSQATRAPGH